MSDDEFFEIGFKARGLTCEECGYEPINYDYTCPKCKEDEDGITVSE